MFEVISKLPLYWMTKKIGWALPLPINYTFALTYKCNSKCKTCNIHTFEPVNELTTEEWQSIILNLYKYPYWVTFSGGEPFLRTDIVNIHSFLCEHAKPKVVNIPTNGLLTRRIVDSVVDMLSQNPQTQLNINVSIDHHEPQVNDYIRGIDFASEKACETFEELTSLQLLYPNLCVSIHTVISKYNFRDFSKIYSYLVTYAGGVDNYITEVAENRVELDTLDLEITPSFSEYQIPLSLLSNGHSKGLRASFRKNYYKLTSEILLKKEQIIPCYAGIMSCQITPDGEVWFCCVKGESVGNLRENEYRLELVWNNNKAIKQRKSISRKECWCPLANVSYTNMLMNPKSMYNIIRNRL